jgi:hypothetical protein
MAFGYKASITIDHTKVPNTDQTDFPILISGTYAGAGGIPNLKSVGNSGHVQSANGYDIYFYSDVGLTNRIPAERESYNASTGAVVFWVKKTVTTASDTVIYMAYGDSGISTDPNSNGTYGATNVWDTNFKGVWHLNGSVNDSSATGANLTSSHGTVAYSTGNIAQALSLDGASNIYNASFGLGSVLDLTNVTLTLWMKTSTSQSTWHALATCQGSYGLYDNSDVPDYYDWGTSTDHRGSTDIHNNAWRFITLVKNDGVTNGTKVYVDGNVASPELTGIATRSTSGTDNTFNIGAGMSSGSSQQFTGLIDEVRVSNSLRSVDWIKTEYNNQNSPSTFYTMGTEGVAWAGGPIKISRYRMNVGELPVNNVQAIKLNEAPTVNQTVSGLVVDMTYGESITMGDLLYFKSDGKVYKADATSIATAKIPCMGLALATASSGSNDVLLKGIYRDDSRYNFTVGGTVYLSTTAGVETQTQPAATDNIVQVVGIATHADRIYFRPSPDYFTHA